MFSLNRGVKKIDDRTYKGFKFWPTKKLKAVIDEPYNRGVDGADYNSFIDEIESIYYNRMNSIIEKNVKLEVQAREFLQ